MATSRQRLSRRARFLLGGLAIATATASGAWAVAEPLSRNLAEYVLLSRVKLQIKQFGFTVSGNVGVNESGGTMQWGRHSFFPDGSQVAGDVLKREDPGCSAWDLFTNVYDPKNVAKSTIRNEGPLPISPLPIIAALPPLPVCVPGGTAVTVPKGGSLTLAPGTYSTVTIVSGGTLTFSGGTYCIASLKTGRYTKLLFDADSELDVAGSLQLGVSGKLGPSTSSGLGAPNVRVNVAGSLCKFSVATKVTATVLAPNASVRFGRRGFYRGQFIGEKFGSDYGTVFTLETCGDGKIDPGEQCDEGEGNGQTGHCCDPTCHFFAAGTPCPDGDTCNGDETCSAFGVCLAGTSLDCNDHNPCTSDSCDKTLGCQHANEANGTSCTDGQFCNGEEVCVGGTCTDQSDPNCDDGNACTTDSCDSGTNKCLNILETGCKPCPNGDADCDDHDMCDGIETCVAGRCAPGTPLDCAVTDPCKFGTCDSAAGCQVAPRPDGTSCDDGTVCTTSDKCTGGSCGGTLLNCNDGNACTSDTCDDVTGCHSTPIPNCPGTSTFCTLTQGAYGNSNGAANGPGGLVTLNPGVLPATVGGAAPSATVNTQAALVAFMPTGGTSNKLCGNASPAPCPNALVMNVAGDVPDPQGSGSNGYGGGVLTGQTLALTLNVKLSNLNGTPPGLASFTLPTAPFCTCGSGPKAGPFSIPASILAVAGTVGDLEALADQALSGATLTVIAPGATYGDITAALDAINSGFDECRSICACN